MASKEILEKLCEVYYLASLPIQKQREVKITKFGTETHEFFLPAEIDFGFTTAIGKPDAEKTKETQDVSSAVAATNILAISWNTLVGENLLGKFQKENPHLPHDPMQSLKTPEEKMIWAERVMIFLGIGPWALQQLESIENKDGVHIGMKRMKNE